MLFWERGKSGTLCLHLPGGGTGPVVVLGAPPRARPPLSLPYLFPSDNQFRMSILERLEQMEKRMADMAAAGQATCRSPDVPPIQVPPRGGRSGWGAEEGLPGERGSAVGLSRPSCSQPPPP